MASQIASIKPKLFGVVVRGSNLRSRGREFDSRPFQCRVAWSTQSSIPPDGIGKSSTGLLAGVKAHSLVSGGRHW